MPRPDARLYGEVSLDTSKLQRGVRQADSALKQLAGAMTAISSAFAVYGIKRVAEYALELGKLGAQSLRLKDSFEKLAESHRGNSDAILAELKRVSQGTISETELILGANRAMMLGLGANAQELGKLMEVAMFYGRSMGLTMTQAWDNIVTGIGRKSPLILDNLGIVGLKMDETTSKAELMAQVIKQGQADIAKAGGLARDAAFDFEELDAKLADLNTRWAELVAVPVMTKTVNFVVNGLEGWERAIESVETMKALATGEEVAPKEEERGGWIFGIDTRPFEESVGKGIADVINFFAGEQIQQNLEQVHQEVEQTIPSLRAYYESLALGLKTVEANSEQWLELRNQIVKAGVLLQELGDAATLDDMNRDVGEIYDMMSDGWPLAIRKILWQLMPVEERLARMDAWAKSFKGTMESIRPSYADYSVAEQFGPKAMAEANLAALKLDVTIAERMAEANKETADDFAAKMKGANNIISSDITEKVNAALGVYDPLRGGPLDRGDAAGEWWRRLADIVKLGEDSPFAEAMRADVAKIADYVVGEGTGAKVLADEGSMRAAAEAITKFAEKIGFAQAAGAIELNTGVVTINWEGAKAAFEQQTRLESDILAGTKFALGQLGLEGGAMGAMSHALEAVASAAEGVSEAAVSGAGGTLTEPPLATMNIDAETLVQTLNSTLTPSLSAVSRLLSEQLNVQLSALNMTIGTDIPSSIAISVESFKSFIADGLEPIMSAAATFDTTAQTLAQTLNSILTPSLSAANITIGTDLPISVANSTQNFKSFIADGLEPAMGAFEQLEAKGESLKTKLEELSANNGASSFVIDFVSHGDEGWINTLDYLKIIDEWVAKEHKTTLKVITEQVAPGPEYSPDEINAKLLSAAQAATENWREMLGILKVANELAQQGAVDIERWGDYWAREPEGVDQFAMNFAILQTRLEQGLISIQQFYHDVGYVASQFQQQYEQRVASTNQALEEQMAIFARMAMGSPLAMMNMDAQTLTQTLQLTLTPSLSAINQLLSEQLNVQLNAANITIGTDLPTSIDVSIESFESFVTDGLEPTTGAAAALNAQLDDMIKKLERLSELDKGDFEPNSPTPFELGLRGINEELERMSIGAIAPARGGGAPGITQIHLHVGAMLGREADAYRLANELLPYLNRARRVQQWD